MVTIPSTLLPFAFDPVIGSRSRSKAASKFAGELKIPAESVDLPAEVAKVPEISLEDEQTAYNRKSNAIQNPIQLHRNSKHSEDTSAYKN